MNSWVVCSGDNNEQETFANLDLSAALEGEQINNNWMSRLVKVSTPGGCYYVKRYLSRGRGLRKYLGRSRLRAEWENLQLFDTIGVPTEQLVAYGESRSGGEYRGVLVTREVENTADLATLAREQSDRFENRQWLDDVIRQLSDAVRTMHSHGFIHNDLKWRNILVELEDNPAIKIIDCPIGRTMFGPFLARGIVKDLACLDKVAKDTLSDRMRLRFYLAYRGMQRLDARSKKEVQIITRFFTGRE